MDGWKMILSFWGPAHFQGRTVGFGEGILSKKHPQNSMSHRKAATKFIEVKKGWKYLKVMKNRTKYRIHYLVHRSTPKFQQFSGMKVISKQQMVGCSKHFEVHPQVLNIESENRPGPNTKLVFFNHQFSRCYVSFRGGYTQVHPQIFTHGTGIEPEHDFFLTHGYADL